MSRLYEEWQSVRDDDSCSEGELMVVGWDVKEEERNR
jgi:hypothetical protein